MPHHRVPLKRHVTRTGIVVAAAAVALLLGASVLSAHDFWLVPTALPIAPGDLVEIHGQTSTSFPTSISAVTPDRVGEARVLSASSDERVTELSVSEKSLMLRYRPTTAGQRVVAVALASRDARTTAERLQRYLALEGAPALAERYAREGAYPKADSVTQTSAKFAKTIVEVGVRGPRAFTRAVGHALELVPVNDPTTLHAGDTLVVRLVYHAKPLAGAQLHAGSAPRDLSSAADSNATHATPSELTLVTTADGTARVPIAEGGLWNVRALHGVAAPGGTGERWEVFFATLVFRTQSAGRRP